jgi:hypothetical protein
MELTSIGEGKVYKALPDGRVLYRIPSSGKTIVLLPDDYAKIIRLRLWESNFSFVVAAPAAIATVLVLKGKISVLTTAEVIGVACLLGVVVNFSFRRFRNFILDRAPESGEQLPGWQRLELLGLVLRRSPDKVFRRGIIFFGLLFLVSLAMVIAKLFRIGAAISPHGPSMFGYMVIAPVSGLILYLLWKEIRRRKRDRQP